MALRALSGARQEGAGAAPASGPRAAGAAAVAPAEAEHGLLAEVAALRQEVAALHKTLRAGFAALVSAVGASKLLVYC